VTYAPARFSQARAPRYPPLGARIPETLRSDFLFRHIHPFDPPGKIMLQLIDPDTALRIDVFRACGQTMSRGAHVDRFVELVEPAVLETAWQDHQAGAPFDISPDQPRNPGIDSRSSHFVDHSRILEKHRGSVPALCAYRGFSPSRSERRLIVVGILLGEFCPLSSNAVPEPNDPFPTVRA
jgi:hypothetical protein